MAEVNEYCGSYFSQGFIVFEKWITSRLVSDELPASEVIDDDTKAATG
jgi:hypothetical protein